MPHGTPAETASLELPFIGFCPVSVSVGSLNAAPSLVRILHCHGQFPPLFDRTRGKSAYIHVYKNAFPLSHSRNNNKRSPVTYQMARHGKLELHSQMA
jgi:hypothetical protein